MVGIPGSGKSFFAERFSETFRAPLISLHKIKESLPNGLDQSAKQILDYLLEQTLKTGKIIIYEGNTSRRSDRTEIAKKAYAAGYDPIFVWVQTEVSEAKKRATRTGGLSNGDFDNHLRQFSPPHTSERFIVISGKHTYNTQLKAISKSIIAPVSEPIKLNTPIKKGRVLIR
jgi:predicted kinase